MAFIFDNAGVSLKFETESQLFSPSGPDRGSVAMLSKVDLRENEKILDLGCGYGLVGITLAKVRPSSIIVMTDIDPAAVRIASRNASINDCQNVTCLLSNGFDGIADDDFTLILSNPPYHIDFSVPKKFIEGSFNHLSTGGRLIMVVKRRLWYENKLRSVFGGVSVKSIDGYFILESEKRCSVKPFNSTVSKTTKKHEKRISRSKRNIAR